MMGMLLCVLRGIKSQASVHTSAMKITCSMPYVCTYVILTVSVTLNNFRCNS